MRTCYIAGKITGLSDNEVYEMFSAAEDEVEKLGFIPVSPITLTHNHDKSWRAYLREDFKSLVQCDAVYALRNWRQSPGATIELNTALMLGLDIIQQKEA